MIKNKIYKLILKILIQLKIILIASNLYAIDWEIYLIDGSKVQCIKMNLEKDSIIRYTDIFNLERFINIDKIETIKRTKNTNSMDKITTKDTIYIGDIIEYKPKNFMSIKLINDSLIFLTISDILNVELSQIDKTPYESLELGLSLGYPAAVNFISGYYINYFGVRVSGSYIYLATGVELELKYKPFQDLAYNHFIKLVIGYSEIKKDKFASQGKLSTFLWKYLGLSYEVRYKGFFIDFGLSYGTGDYKIPNLIYKFGYSYFFEI